jgi:hypothetical protein
VIKRLLSDRVDAKAGRATIGGERHLVALPSAHEAEATLTFMQLAIAWADVALDPAVL